MARPTAPLYLAKTRCTVCGEIFMLWRQQSRRKKAGHIKHVYCWVCRAITAHAELAADVIDEPAENDR